MRRYWKRWLGLLIFVAVLGTTFVLLGRWQLNRLQERKDNNAVVTAHENEPPLPFEQTFHGTVRNEDQWVRVTVTGTYDDAQTLQVRYRSNNSQQGPEFVTPLHATDGRTVLVDRGYLRSLGGKDPDAPPAPLGTVTVTGYLRRDEQGQPAATDPVNRQCRLINAPAIGKTLPYPVVDGYLTVITSQPAEELKPIPTPALDEGPHLSYAIQWFCFCALAVAGLVVFIRGDIRDARKARRTTAAADNTTVGAHDAPAAGSAPAETAREEAAAGQSGGPGGATTAGEAP